MPGLEGLAFLLRRGAGQRVLRLSAAAARAGRPPRLLRPAGPPLEVVESPRLFLGLPTEAQARAYFDTIIGTSMFDTLIWDGPRAPEDLLDFYVRAAQARALGWPRAFDAGIILRDDGGVEPVGRQAVGVLIGGLSARYFPGDPGLVDIGYTLAPAWHGRGLATEAVTALVERELRVRPQTQRLQAEVFVGNVASARVLEKLGFIREGTHRAAVVKRGQRLDVWFYGLTRADWERRAAAPL